MIEDPSRSFEYEVAKRVFDVVAAVLLLVVCAPLVAGLCIYVALTSGLPVLIAQERIGRGGRHFQLLKLRTLPREALECADHGWAVESTSKLMSFLRRTGLDELPQLVNVLRGEMSLVGPRPERPFFVKRFSEEMPAYAARHRLHVGLTGWAQIHGFRGNTSIPARLEYDLHYVRNWSLGLDVRILLRTGRAVVRDLLTDGGKT